ncbi:MAG: EF-hand domain-containing protein [Hyphomonadaceae bacterium]|nr:EF-hand domain-containing protein [Hyphomonadaceae bacterium]
MTDDKRPRREKKSETLEVRIPYETKQAFLTACREDGTTASEVVRTSVQTYLDERGRPTPQQARTLIMKLPQPVRRYGLRIAAGGIAAVGLATFAALPSAAAPDFATQFKTLDKNGDGMLSADEFTGPKGGNEDGKDVIVETRVHKTSKDGANAPPANEKPEIKQEAFSFWLPDGADGAQQQSEYKFVSRHEVRVQSGDGASTTPPTPPNPPSLDDIRKNEFDTFDTNKDGKVSLAEYQSRQKAMLTRGFEILDQNNDKTLTLAEYEKIVSPPLPKIAGEPDTPDVRVQGGPTISSEALKASFTKLDVNRDNRLSLAEYLPPA